MEYGLIGEKLTHSFSKDIHEQLADYTYDITPLTREEFPIFMEKHDFKAINVTIPYKQSVIPYIDVMSDSAKAIGAVNTIVNKEGKLYGYNTDYYGFLYMCRHNGVELKGKKVLVLGNGGASKAVCAVVRNENAAECIIVDIVPAQGVITYEECLAKHTDVDIIINTSPVGMYPKVDASPLDLTGFKKCEAVLDVIYNPLTTKITAQARELGMKGVNGLEMLVAQAKYAVEYFLDTKIDDSVIDGIYKKLYEEKSN